MIQELEESRRAVDVAGRREVEAARSIYNRLSNYIDRYEEPAKGHGDFESYLEFQSVLAEIEEELSDDVYGKEAFENALGRFESRTLRAKHFERAKNDLKEVQDVVESLEREEHLVDELETETGRLRKRRREIENELQDLDERISHAKEATNVEYQELKELVEKYNQRVEEEFRSYISSASAVDVARLARKLSNMPLLPTPAIEDGAVDVLESPGVKDESVDRVLEYAGYSNSKLEHYVDRPEEFRKKVPEAWFRTADAGPFKLSLDEREGVVERKIPELVRVISIFSGEETVRVLRKIGDLARKGEYSELRSAHKADQRSGGKDPGTLREKKEELRKEIEEIDRELERISEVLDR